MNGWESVSMMDSVDKAFCQIPILSIKDKDDVDDLLAFR